MAVDHTAIQLALRNRALALASPTTGSVSLSATTTGYARASGSFITDGFAVGMEVTAAGFSTAANNGASVITALTATAMTVTKSTGPTTESAGSRSLTVGLPACRAWEGVHLEPATDFPFLEEEYVPATAELPGLITGGTVHHTGLYILRWYGVANRGLVGLTDPVDNLLALFPPGYTLTVTNHEVRIRADLAPWRGPQRTDRPGWSVITVTIPWRAYTLN